MGGFDAPITVVVWDYDSDGSHALIGTTVTSLRDLSYGPYQLGLINEKKVGRYDVLSTNYQGNILSRMFTSSSASSPCLLELDMKPLGHSR